MTKTEQSFVLNTLELILQIVTQQQSEIQHLKDEINRLKGEQGKPNISGNTQKRKVSLLAHLHLPIRHKVIHRKQGVIKLITLRIIHQKKNASQQKGIRAKRG